GGLVALPTETVYGLAALALDPLAVRAIYSAKARPATNPLIVHVSGAAEARPLVGEWPRLAQRLADAFWPGPLTLVLPRTSLVPACSGPARSRAIGSRPCAVRSRADRSRAALRHRPGCTPATTRLPPRWCWATPRSSPRDRRRCPGRSASSRAPTRPPRSRAW